MWSSIRFVTYLHASIGTMLKFQLDLLLHGIRNMVFNVIATHSNEISHENGFLLNAIDKMKYIQASIVKALRHIIFVLIQLVFCILIIARSCDSMIYWLMEMHYEQIDRSFARISTKLIQINNRSQFHRRLILTDFFWVQNEYFRGLANQSWSMPMSIQINLIQTVQLNESDEHPTIKWLNKKFAENRYFKNRDERKTNRNKTRKKIANNRISLYIKKM